MVLLFGAVFITAAGYGATFLLTDHFRALGGNEIDTGWLLAAAAIGTLIGVPSVGWLAPRHGAARLTACGSLAVAVGFWVLGVLESISPAVVICGFLIGVGWGAFYLSSPLALSDRVTDKERMFWFMWLGAIQMLGIGAGPTIADIVRTHLALSTGAMFHGISYLCITASVFAVSLEYLWPRSLNSVKPSANWVRSIVQLARTPAIFPIAMVLLGACVFASVLTFQSSIAQDGGFDHRVFFLAYTLTVVVSRFALAPIASRSDPDSVSIALLAVMGLGVAVAMVQGSSLVLYVLGAVLLGIGYGLVYSIIQAQVVNDAPAEHRNAALTWFVLAYFLGVFGFPLLGGIFIVHFGIQAMLATLLALSILELLLALRWRRSRRMANATFEHVQVFPMSTEAPADSQGPNWAMDREHWPDRLAAAGNGDQGAVRQGRH